MTLVLPAALRAELRCRAEAGRMRGLVAEWCLVTRDQLMRGKLDSELQAFLGDACEVFGAATFMHPGAPAD